MTSLSTIVPYLPQTMSVNSQITDWEMQGEKVAMYRNYYDGDHPANLTPQMRQLLRINRRSINHAHVRNGGGEFNANYMQLVIDTMADRTNLDTVLGDNDAVTAWASEVLENNRIDGLNGDVHSATILDAVSYLMASWDNDKGEVRFTHELAYDGNSGIVVLYESSSSQQMAAALKIWCLSGSSYIDTIRINVYLPDRIRKFESINGGAFVPYVDDSTDANGEARWVKRDGAPLGIPIIPFFNRPRKNQGLSEIENAIPLQDALNRTLHSLVMTEELTAFQIRWIKGAVPPSDVTPGMWVGLATDGMTSDQIAEIGVLPAGDISQILAAYDKIAGEIGKITRTPAPEFIGASHLSGEALKQLEIGLIGKVGKFQIKAGNSWENAMSLAWYVQEAFGSAPPAWTRFYAKWKNAEIRDDQVTIDNAIKIAPYVDDRTLLETIAEVYGWDSEQIDRMMDAKQNSQAQRIASLVSNLPTYGNFNAPGQVPGAINNQTLNGQQTGAITNG